MQSEIVVIGSGASEDELLIKMHPDTLALTIINGIEVTIPATQAAGLHDALVSAINHASSRNVPPTDPIAWLFGGDAEGAVVVWGTSTGVTLTLGEAGALDSRAMRPDQAQRIADALGRLIGE